MNAYLLKVKYWLKEILIFVILTLMISLIISYFRQPNLSFTKLPLISGTLIDKSDFSTDRWLVKKRDNKPMLIYFWGTWCPMCTLQSPIINSLSSEVEVLSIAINSGPSKQLEQYMAKKGFLFNVLNDQKKQWSRFFQVTAYPTVFLFDRSGKLHFAEVGYTSKLGLKARLAWMDLTH